jgi:hypothetical protein
MANVIVRTRLAGFQHYCAFVATYMRHKKSGTVRSVSKFREESGVRCVKINFRNSDVTHEICGLPSVVSWIVG